MNITNPTNFGIPGLTLTTANAEGTGNAVRTGASILAFDATDPAAVAASAVVGTATVSARRDHVHAGVGGAGTVVDNAIARFNGTGGSAIQGYSSASPVISDAGVITLTSGQLVFPATQAASAGANTLDDYEEGTFTPTVNDNSNDDDEGQSYTVQVGRYTKIGNRVFFNLEVILDSLGSLEPSEGARVAGLPYPALNVTNGLASCVCMRANGLSITALASVGGLVQVNTDYLFLRIWDGTAQPDTLLLSELTADGGVSLSGQYEA